MRIDQKTDTTPELRDPAAEAEAVRAVASTTAAVTDVVARVASGAAPWVDDVVELGDDLDDMGPALSFIGHLTANESVATTRFGQVRDATLRTAVDGSVDAGLATVAQAAGGRALLAAPASAGLGLADALTEDASAAGIAVDMARSFDPGTQIAAGAYGLIDGAAITLNLMTGRTDEAMAQGQQMQDQALNGGYGSAGQGLSLAVGVATGDAHTLSAATDRSAEQGERGVMPMIGNYLGDTWADIAGHNVPEPEGRFVDAEAYERSTRFVSLFGL